VYELTWDVGRDLIGAVRIAVFGVLLFGRYVKGRKAQEPCVKTVDFFGRRIESFRVGQKIFIVILRGQVNWLVSCIPWSFSQNGLLLDLMHSGLFMYNMMGGSLG
jgi:hypothetical protein